MTDIDFLLNQNNPAFMAKKIAGWIRKERIKQQLTQADLAEKSGISLSTLKHFEQKGEISLIRILKIASILGVVVNFERIFEEDVPNSIEEHLQNKKQTNKQRVRKSKRK